ncbi:CHAP domain-containing protein [Asticcacaulis sp. EMRT-3]|uniref:CHAP domain-containing protein n=1 Tax=Asticcacaulis sp. EMRT-3 TaxID=3040349 RepID=UPI0024AFB8C4|nr:CHAP domain-containing protein [Asticcacaulis sp. EMRT-3]MDI7776227.1 CHAP domain-containing protein [Asticcacaulis sp. EMRT-3]
MKKTVSAFAFAMITLCTASPLYARTVSHAKARSSHHVSASTPYLQCVTFARQLSGIQIFGDAWTWWEKATDKYDEGHAPKPGAVLVFRPQGKMRLGHVAVVTQIITNRYIQVTHANWSPINGRRGQVEDHVNVLDVSDKGDWSKVKVWYGPLNDLGTTVYDTYGFIYNNTPQKVAEPETQPQTSPMAAPVQVAVTDTPASIPDELKAALTPGNTQGFLNAKARPVTVSAHVKGKAAAQLVAQIDNDAPDDSPKPVLKSVSHKAHAKKAAESHAKRRHHPGLRHR